MQKIARNLQKLQKITKNEQKLHEIGAFWTMIEVPPRAFERAGEKDPRLRRFHIKRAGEIESFSHQTRKRF